jgi:hypothetical protein
MKLIEAKKGLRRGGNEELCLIEIKFVMKNKS